MIINLPIQLYLNQKSITTIKKSFVYRMQRNKKSLSFITKNDILLLLFALNKIKFNLKRAGLYGLLKLSFHIKAIKIYIFHLKLLEQNSKEYLFNILHKKLNSWINVEKSPLLYNKYSALHYAK